jgi:four helix bundle protein
MAGIRKFEELESWQAARRLNQLVWDLFRRGAFGRDFALADQINRSAGSAMDNIAEGFDSGSDVEFARFLRYAQRSCSELQSQLYRALDRGHIRQDEFQHLSETALEVSNKTGGFIKYLTKDR